MSYTADVGRGAASSTARSASRRRRSAAPRAVLAVGDAVLGRDLQHHPGRERRADHHRRRSTAPTSRRRSTGRTRASRAGRPSGSTARVPVLRGGNVWRRDVYPLVDWAVIPLPTVQFFGGNDGFRPQLSAAVPRQRDASRRGCRSRTRIRQPVLGVFDDPGVDRERRRPLPPVRQRVGALLRRLGAEADPADRRLPVQARTATPMPARRPASSSARSRGVGGEVLWKPVEQNWGARRSSSTTSAQRDFYSPFGFGYYDYDVVTGHASLYWDTGWYGIEAQLAAGRYLAGDWGGTLFAVAAASPTAGRSAPIATKTDVTDRGLRRGQLRQGPAADHPAALGDAVRDPADDRRRPALARRATAARGSTSQNRLYPIVRDLDREPARAQLGSVLAMMRILALLALAALGGCGSGGSDPIVQAAIEEFGGFWGRRGEQPAGAAARPITRADIAARRRCGDPGAARVRPVADADVRAGAERWLRHLRLGAAAEHHAARHADHRRPAASAPTCCRPGASRPDPLAQADPAGKLAGERASAATSCPATGRSGEIAHLRLHVRARAACAR